MPQQPVSLVDTEQADALGHATFTFAQPPQNLTYVGSLACKDAPLAATFSAQIGTDHFGGWPGPAPYGPVSFPSAASAPLVITAAALVPGSTYHCYFIGIADDADQVQPSYPSPTAPSVSSGASICLVDRDEVSLGQATVVGSHVYGPWPGANFGGARFSFQNDAGNGPLYVGINYYTPTMQIIATKELVVPDDGGAAAFAFPHLGELFDVHIANRSNPFVGPLDVWTTVDHQVAVDHSWAIPRIGGVEMGMLIYAESVAVAPLAGTPTILGTALGTYAGPATVSMNGHSLTSTWSLRVEAQSENATWHPIYYWDGGAAAFLQPSAITVPPRPLRLVLHNDGAASVVTASLVVDDWRAA